MGIDNTPKAVKEVLDKPGQYVFESNGFHWAFEVDEKGKVYQLKPMTLKRDGFPLSPGGWNECSFEGTVRPLDRTQWLAQFE